MEHRGIWCCFADFFRKCCTCVEVTISTTTSASTDYCYQEYYRAPLQYDYDDRYTSLSDEPEFYMPHRAVVEVEVKAEVNSLPTPSMQSFVHTPVHSRVHNNCVGSFSSLTHKRRRRSRLTRYYSQDINTTYDLYVGDVQNILRRSLQWKFNAFTFDAASEGRCLPLLCMHLFDIYGLISYFNLDLSTLWKLFSQIEARYESTNPYHNAVHAADVTQAMHCFLQQEKIFTFMEPLEIMAALLGAITHDIDHPGVNQSFLIATSSFLTTMYGNSSVLENHHRRVAVSCINQSGLIKSSRLRKKLTDLLSSLIMATDITRQEEYLSQFKMYLDSNTLDMTKGDHRHLVMQIAIKTADISNPCRPWDISNKWSLKVCKEFFRQGDLEHNLKLPITSSCDRNGTSIPEIQTGEIAVLARFDYTRHTPGETK